MEKMNPHNWEIITIAAGGGLDIGEFFHCFACGTSGGPTGWGPPGSYGRFLAGTGLSGLPEDCDAARLKIDAFAAMYKEYAERVDEERSYWKLKLKPGSSARTTDNLIDKNASHVTYARCPLCEDDMVWDQAKAPLPGEWCDQCRDDAVRLLSADSSHVGIRFRAMIGLDVGLKSLLKAFREYNE